MKIKFEEWIEDNQISEEAMNLFRESISCYRIGAYRSAFIMSYIAFQNIMKQRILDASIIPTSIKDNMWRTICSKLRDEDEWDTQVAECVKRDKPNQVFLISESVKKLYEGFRCIRNTCAHGKSGKIEYFHVEHLWSFIQENFTRFTVNGGKLGIIKMIEDHYDTSITPVGADTTYIVDNIKISIKNDEIEELLESLYKMNIVGNGGRCFSSEWRQIELWDKLVNDSTLAIQEQVITFMKNKHTAKINLFIERYPHTVDLFLSDSQFSRKLWNEIIFDEWEYWYDGTWIMIDKILDNNIIPEKEKDNFNKRLFEYVGSTFPEGKAEILEKTDYFDRLKSNLFNRNQYTFPNTFSLANSNAISIIKYITKFGLDLETVSTINYLIGQSQFGYFLDSIHGYLQDDDNWSVFRRILEENDITDYTTKFCKK